MMACVPLEAGYDEAVKKRPQQVLVSITPGASFDSKRVAEKIPEHCCGVVIECGYVPPTRIGVDAYNRFEIPQRLQTKTDAPA